jgi:hypothetical protein
MPTILTNALLSMGFSLVANFTNVVPVPPDLVPTRVDDVRAYEIGSGSWPVDINMASKRGGYFEIKHGVVIEYSSPTSLLHNQDPNSLERFRGTASLDSKEVLKLAEQVVRRLARRGDPIAGRLGKVDRLRDWNTGAFMPFYRVTWPNSSPDEPLSPADIEIDARNGQIVSVWLGGFTFYDLAFSWEMRKRAYIPDPLDRIKPEAVEDGTLAALRPFTKEMFQAIKNLSRVCERLEAKPLTSTNLTEIDWKNTCVYTNDWIAPNTIVSRVAFTNGSWLDAVGTTACDVFAADACYVDEWWTRTPEQWFIFDGKINYSWEKLTQDLEAKLRTRLHISQKLLARYGRRLRNTSIVPLGETGLKRILVDWTNGAPQKVEYRANTAWAWQNHIGYSAEFDVESGELKSIRFRDPELIEALRDAQSLAGSSRKCP